ncbi:hypothetical protein [Nocardia sp. NPDC050710]|uniref:hypothetical protein n=1 Tax=Nocardia sp. NPDC050710 TaxID=3157220 RepID=UPI0033FBF8E2
MTSTAIRGSVTTWVTSALLTTSSVAGLCASPIATYCPDRLEDYLQRVENMTFDDDEVRR